jgi:hypothetical protein
MFSSPIPGFPRTIGQVCEGLIDKRETRDAWWKVGATNIAEEVPVCKYGGESDGRKSKGKQMGREETANESVEEGSQDWVHRLGFRVSGQAVTDIPTKPKHLQNGRETKEIQENHRVSQLPTRARHEVWEILSGLQIHSETTSQRKM